MPADEILVQREKMQFIMDLYEEVTERLTGNETELFTEWLLYGKSYTQIGKEKTSSKIVGKLSKDDKSKAYRRIRAVKTGKQEIRRILKKLRKIILKIWIIIY